jgi:hypothetical protein
MGYTHMSRVLCWWHCEYSFLNTWEYEWNTDSLVQVRNNCDGVLFTSRSHCRCCLQGNAIVLVKRSWWRKVLKGWFYCMIDVMNTQGVSCNYNDRRQVYGERAASGVIDYVQEMVLSVTVFRLAG